MIFVDSHTHLYLDNFDADRAEVVERAIARGIEYMMLPAIDKSTFAQMRSLLADFPKNCFPMIGLHPTSVNDSFGEELDLVEKELEKGGYYAVGEIGIDLYWDKTFRDQQQFVFRHQLKLAKKYNLAVAIHTRDSFEDVYKIVEEEQDGSLRGVFHCFTGSVEDAKKIIGLNFYLGIGGIVSFKNSGQDKVVKDIPLQKILLETDSPFLTPAPFRGKRNESSYISIIAEKIAEVKALDIGHIAKTTTNNAIELFGLRNE
ncbi:MAG: TatD family hydrolase [Chlorobi bacterium]|nr:TatD family hydrolase [Chlorobiota bacterium]